MNRRGLRFGFKKIGLLILLLLVCIAAVTLTVLKVADSSDEYSDERIYAHGISYVELAKDRGALIWSENKTDELNEESWEHDVYYAVVDRKDGSIGDKKTLIEADEAQEPASASVDDNGNIIVTFEDGNVSDDNVLQQSYAIFNRNFEVVKAYPQIIGSGGHSGHSASSGDKHVVIWNEDWIEGGGEDDLGTGVNLYLTVLSSKGKKIKTEEIMEDGSRNWWPLLDSLENKTCLLWQQYVDGEDYASLEYAIYDTEKMELVRQPETIDDTLEQKYYSYSVTCLPAYDEFLIIGCENDGAGKAYLIDESGNIIDEQEVPGIGREITPAQLSGRKSIQVAYVDQDGNLVILEVDGSRIEFDDEQELRGEMAKTKITTLGTACFYDNQGKLHVANLTKAGLRVIDLE